jgi:hypothetical protein
MRLVRSDETITTGELVPIDTLKALAPRWYGNRLDPGWRPRTRDESQAIFEAVGLTGEFWALP